MYEMARTARLIVESILRAQPGERVTIVTDTEAPATVTEVLAAASYANGAVPVVVRMGAHEVGGQEPVAPVTAAIEASDIVILQGSYALVHTDAFRGAVARGVRLLELWGVTEEMMRRGGLLADYEEVGRVTRAIATRVKESKRARLTTPAGTDLSVQVEGRPVLALACDPIGPGEFCSLPGGEVTVSPVEGSAEGVLVDPFLLEQKELGYRSDPLRIEVRDGKVTDISGGREAVGLTRLLESADDAARNIAEFAVGTNRWCRPFVSLREAKKALGTAHVALGDNKTLGGNVFSRMHMDMIFAAATVTFDEVTVLAEGRPLIG
jgi:leucyl aminopeptidase (aminopeptidase T)